ncbi:MAG: hypothetical protein M1825_001656 [Sarcosagium campestre]|nr:MAG: hypothetical protein M1825_001656 [Sarcosagium campestre]
MAGLDVIFFILKVARDYTNMEWWQSFFHDLGSHTVETCVAGQRMVFTDDPENIKALLASQFNDFGKGEPFHKDWHDFLGDSIFTTDLGQWHESRQLIRPQFIKNRVSDLAVFERHASKMIRRLDRPGEFVDVQEVLFQYTLDAATDFLLGKSVNSLDNPQIEFAAAFSEVQRVQGLIARLGPANRLYPRGSFLRGLDVINNFLEPFIDRALSLSPEELLETKSGSSYTFLHALAIFTRDRKILRDQLVAILLAGRDTTAATLSWTFYELSRHPEVVIKLRHEILEAVGPTLSPTYAELKNMKYLQHTMNETLRLYPALPFNMRLALHDTSLPHGGGHDKMQPVGIPKDTPCGYSPLTMQRRPDLYPPPSPTFAPVDVFSPERWDSWIPKAWQYIPFNGGPRICIGQQFALTEMAYTIVRLLQNFEKLEQRSPEKAALRTEIVLQPAHGVFVEFRRPANLS